MMKIKKWIKWMFQKETPVTEKMELKEEEDNAYCFEFSIVSQSFYFPPTGGEILCVKVYVDPVRCIIEGYAPKNPYFVNFDLSKTPKEVREWLSALYVDGLLYAPVDGGKRPSTQLLTIPTPTPEAVVEELEKIAYGSSL